MSLKICSLASGSKGNCCFVSDGRTDILIDLGISAVRAEKCLSVLGVDPDSVNILVTHSHVDHIGGLKTFCKKHGGASVMCQRESARAIEQACGILPTVISRIQTINGLIVQSVCVSHDVPCFGYVISDGQKSVSVMTDIGVVTKEQLDVLGSCSIVMLEANHNSDMLRANPKYTPVLKERIASRRGHLSNGDCGAACAYLASNGVKNFILAHLSEENNTPEMAIGEVRAAVDATGAENVRIVAATQNAMTGLFVVC